MEAAPKATAEEKEDKSGERAAVVTDPDAPPDDEVKSAWTELVPRIPSNAKVVVELVSGSATELEGAPRISDENGVSLVILSLVIVDPEKPGPAQIEAPTSTQRNADDRDKSAGEVPIAKDESAAESTTSKTVVSVTGGVELAEPLAGISGPTTRPVSVITNENISHVEKH